MPTAGLWEECDECKRECVGFEVSKNIDGKEKVKTVCEECRAKLLADGWKPFCWWIKK